MVCLRNYLGLADVVWLARLSGCVVVGLSCRSSDESLNSSRLFALTEGYRIELFFTLSNELCEGFSACENRLSAFGVWKVELIE